jgi:hypothetical protein
MNNYAPDTEAPTERVMLIDIGYSQYEGDYRHLLTTVVRRAQADTVDADTGARRYFDGSGDDAGVGYRNCSWSSGKANALYVEDLQITNQFGRFTDEPPYGETVAFKPYKVEQREAVAMAKTFAKLETKGKQISDLHGYPRTYAELVIRTALALGIKRFAVYRENSSTNKTLTQKFREFGPGDVAYHVDELVAKARAGGR